MKSFATIVNSLWLLTVVVKILLLDVSWSPGYFSNNHFGFLNKQAKVMKTLITIIIFIILIYLKAAFGDVLKKKVSLKILQKSQENTRARVSF